MWSDYVKLSINLTEIYRCIFHHGVTEQGESPTPKFQTVCIEIFSWQMHGVTRVMWQAHARSTCSCLFMLWGVGHVLSLNNQAHRMLVATVLAKIKEEEEKKHRLKATWNSESRDRQWPWLEEGAWLTSKQLQQQSHHPTHICFRLS